MTFFDAFLIWLVFLLIGHSPRTWSKTARQQHVYGAKVHGVGVYKQISLPIILQASIFYNILALTLEFSLF